MYAKQQDIKRHAKVLEQRIRKFVTATRRAKCTDTAKAWSLIHETEDLLRKIDSCRAGVKAKPRKSR